MRFDRALDTRPHGLGSVLDWQRRRSGRTARAMPRCSPASGKTRARSRTKAPSCIALQTRAQNVPLTSDDRLESMQTAAHTSWHELPVGEVAGLLETDLLSGLSAAEVESRLKQYGPNKVTEKPGTPATRGVRSSRSLIRFSAGDVGYDYEAALRATNRPKAIVPVA